MIFLLKGMTCICMAIYFSIQNFISVYLFVAIATLEALCLKGIHLENPTEDPRHQWAPPNTNTLHTRTSDTRIYSAPNSKHPRYALPVAIILDTHCDKYKLWQI